MNFLHDDAYTIIHLNQKKMRRFLSYSASLPVASAGLLILRLGFGGLMLPHGYDKIIHYAEYKEKFMSFMGLSPAISLGLNIFAEFFCAIFIVLGLLTRFATIPLIIAMSVALFMVHNGDVTGKGQAATLFLLAFMALLFTGAGKYSLDGALYKHR
jgi:putative oxidoreductase